MIFSDLQQLRSVYLPAKERALRKQLDKLDLHCSRFVSHSPFLVVSTHDDQGRPDASPRGGDPGFVKVTAHGQLLIPDSPGNNRLDSLQNIIQTGRIGLLFMIPGVDETLRINGTAVVTNEPEHLASFASTRERLPRAVICVSVEEAYLHCAKSLIRSRLWARAGQVGVRPVPTLNEMIHDQIGDPSAPESQAAMVERYKGELY